MGYKGRWVERKKKGQMDIDNDIREEKIDGIKLHSGLLFSETEVKNNEDRM